MGSKGSSRHQKRLSAPIVYPIKRKHGTFTIRPYPPRFTKEYSIPLGIVLREILGYAKNLREAKKILKNEVVKVDGKTRTSYKFAICPMDILEITETSEYFRVTPYQGRRKLVLHPIPESQKNWKLLRVKRKQKIRGNKIQLTFHDGTNLIWKDDYESESLSIKDIRPQDSVKYDLVNKVILEHYPFEIGNSAVVLGGHNTGIFGHIRSYEKRYGRYKSIVLLETNRGNIQTSKEHVFITGKEDSAIEIPTPEGE